MVLRLLKSRNLWWSAARQLSTAVPHPDIVVIQMPQLSPSMNVGAISRWLKAAGDEIPIYDVFMEVETEELTEDAYKLGQFAGTVTLQIESQDHLYLARILVDEGKEVAVGTPVALACENPESIESINAQLKSSNKLLEELTDLRTLTWQSYLKSEGPAQSCSSGCM